AAVATTTSTQDLHLIILHVFNIPLALTCIIIAFGIILVKFNRELARAMTNFGAPISGLDAVEKLRQGTIDLGAKYATKPSGTTSMRRHLVLPFLMLILITIDRKSTRLNSSHVSISYAVFCLNRKKE